MATMRLTSGRASWWIQDQVTQADAVSTLRFEDLETGNYTFTIKIDEYTSTDDFVGSSTSEECKLTIDHGHLRTNLDLDILSNDCKLTDEMVLEKLTYNKAKYIEDDLAFSTYTVYVDDEQVSDCKLISVVPCNIWSLLLPCTLRLLR